MQPNVDSERFLTLKPDANRLMTQDRKKAFFPFSVYQIGLFAADIVLVILAFFLSLRLTHLEGVLAGKSAQSVMVAYAAVVMLSFFPTYHLYNYHIIFAVKNHYKNLSKAFFWSILSFLVIILLYGWPVLLSANATITGVVIFMAAAGLLIFNRFVRNHLVNFVKAMGIACVAVGAAGLMINDGVPVFIAHPAVLSMAIPLAVLSILLGRHFLVHIVFNVWMRRHFRQQIAVVGSNGEAQKIVDHIIRLDAPFWVAGIVEVRSGYTEKRNIESKQCMGTLNVLPQIVSDHKLNEIIITDESIDKRTLISLLDYCINAGIIVWFPPNYLPIIEMKLYIDNFCGLPMIRMCSQRNSNLFTRTKHVLDALITLPIFVLQLPLFLIIAAAIKIDSKGPVFYRAEAIGRFGQKFRMLKFRSMYIDQSSDIHKKYVSRLIRGEIKREDSKHVPLKIVDDRRVTRAGRILRKFSLDELPQLINVLKGEMSLIGPRPCLPYEYEIYKDWHKKRQSVRPGISGLWQVAGRSEVSFEEMVLLDLYYIYNRNLIMDLSIFFETAYVVFSRKGAY